ncbi:uncharacterized protein LOC118511998 [Anopheles stephensi]|uniref:uncharacterized protein LOC118511998 n=1 Tax=Anopheles stephensi TaxID=30069 RepID=UPI001658C227|nr:uncharacterized protein LOC118511998 [Anopheles stephensi]
MYFSYGNEEKKLKEKKNGESNCIVTPQYANTSMLITDNLLLIENADRQLIKSDCGLDLNDRIVTGNFLLAFSNCTIQFQDKKFTSKEIHVKNPSVSGTTFNIAIHRKVVETPLTSLDNRTLTNRKHIEHIYLEQYKNSPRLCYFIPSPEKEKPHSE